jgi:hypothetical protein
MTDNICYQCKKEKDIELFYKKNDKYYKICLECRKSIYCEHEKEKRKCIKCSGSQICQHKKNKYRCKICSEKLGIFCIHNVEKYDCILCEGNGICEHKRRLRNCIECNGNGICEHKKRKSECKICEGSQICKHKKNKKYCRDCFGSVFCEHDISKYVCKICNPIKHLISLQRRRINYILKDKKSVSKTKHTIEYLGCSEEFLFTYITSKLTDDMKEFGYEIDHIKPISKFNLEDEEELLKCCHWSNLQPLLIKDNRFKSNKWTDEDEIQWNKIVHVCRQTIMT